jgi:hypothetical protein
MNILTDKHIRKIVSNNQHRTVTLAWTTYIHMHVRVRETSLGDSLLRVVTLIIKEVCRPTFIRGTNSVLILTKMYWVTFWAIFSHILEFPFCT